MPALVNVESQRGVRLTAVAVSVLLVASFALSADALVATTLATGVHGWLAWLGPLVVDGTIAVATYVALVMRQRGHRGRFAAAWVLVLLSTVLSARLNHLHALAASSDGWVRDGALLLAPWFPVVVLCATFLLEWLLVATPAQVSAQRAVAADTAVADVQREQKARLDAALLAAETDAAIKVEKARIAEAARVQVAALKGEAPAAPAAAPAPARIPAPTVDTDPHPRRAPVAPAPTSPQAPAPTSGRAKVVCPELGAQAAALRAQGLSQPKVAERLGVSKATVQRSLALVG